MSNKNICKFISDHSENKLETHCFIYETNSDTMSKEYHLKSHRAFLVKSGNGVFVIDNIEYPVSSGCLILGFCNEKYHVVSDSNCEFMYISFLGNRAEILFRRFGISKNFRQFKNFDGLIPLWYDSIGRASDKNIDLVSESILLYTLSHLDNKKNEQSNLVNKIIEITENCFSDPDLSITSIAEKLSYNPKYLSHIFKKEMSVGYSQYLRTYRIKYAISLLNIGIDSVKNISFLSGFSDPFYFSNVFKDVVGISPKNYKGKNKNDT